MPSSRVVIAISTLVLVLVALVAAPAPAAAQTTPAPPASPFAPTWAMLSGWDVFAKSGCGKCHAIRGTGGGVGPDLARIAKGGSFFELGAAMWNHVPQMGARMRATNIDKPKLTAREAADLIAFLFTAQYFDELGNAQAGEKLFASKGCVKCHAVGGQGGTVGPALDRLKRANSPVLVATAMWNHGPQMAAVMKEQGIPRPTFQGRELGDLIAYIVATAKDTSGQTEQVVPGTPDRGERLFADFRCVECHAVGGKGGRIGPDFGRAGHHLSLTRFAGLMWNHGPAMWAKMKERGVEVPKLGGQDMADILAYVYVSHYFDQRASARHGQQLVREKGCTTCHSVRGKGGTLAADFATSTQVGSPAALIAGMWNHSTFMEAKAQAQGVAWPMLSGQDLADISAYFGSLRPTKAK